MKILEATPPDVDDDIIRIMQNVLIDGVSRRAGNHGPSVTPHEKTVSATANYLYINALLNKNQLDEYFGVTLNLMMVTLNN